MKDLFKKIIKGKLEGIKIPIIVGWALTHKCNQRCLYCRVWKVRCRELNTRTIFSIINELSKMGMMRICFTGGEPLLRKDIGKIIKFAHRKNIIIELNTNGSLVKKKISQIKNVYSICLSLDGPKRIHDLLRGRGSFKRVIEAAIISKEEDIPNVVFRAVLSKLNLDYIDNILDIAERLKIKVAFQPATQLIYGLGSTNPFAPPVIGYRRVIDKLIIKKKNGNRWIFNSLAGLKYLRQWPKPKKISCMAGRIYFHIEPNGMIYTCHWGRDPESIEKENCLKLGIEKAIGKLPDVVCDGCWNAANLEVNYNLSLLSRKSYHNIKMLLNEYRCRDN